MKIIANKNVSMTNEEFDYYNELVKNFSKDTFNGASYFYDLFEVDNDGFITIIKPNKPIPQIILFFVQQLMISQRIRIIDELRKG